MVARDYGSCRPRRPRSRCRPCGHSQGPIASRVESDNPLDARTSSRGTTKYALDLPVVGAPTVVAARPRSAVPSCRSTTRLRAPCGVLGYRAHPGGVPSRPPASTRPRRLATHCASVSPGPNAGLSTCRSGEAPPPRPRSPRRRSAACPVSREFDFAFAPHAHSKCTRVSPTSRVVRRDLCTARRAIVASRQSRRVGCPRQGDLHVVRWCSFGTTVLRARDEAALISSLASSIN